MKLNSDLYSRELLWIICVLKAYHDAGNGALERTMKNAPVETDYYVDFMLEGVASAAPESETGERVFDKYCARFCDDQINVWSYSSKEMRKCYELARKIHRLSGKSNEKNPHTEYLNRRILELCTVDSYNFDFFIVKKQRRARIEVVWHYEFYEELAICLWITRVMEMFREELPRLQKKYREAKRRKQVRQKERKGGKNCAAKG